MYLAEIDISNKAFNPVARFKSFADIVNLIIPVIIGLAAILFFVTFLRAGLMIIMSGGDVEKYKKAQKTFKYAIGGLILVLLSYFIVKLIGRYLNIEMPL